MAQEHDSRVSVRTLDPLSDPAKFHIDENASLLNLMQEGAQRLAVALLPTPTSPFDLLHNILQHDEIGPAITDLDQAVGDFIKQKHTTRDFGIELVRAFRVNTRWAVAPEPELSPRQILALPAINLDFQTYTLYLPNSSNPLPLDTPVSISRGSVFEAQADGKYGYAQ